MDVFFDMSSGGVVNTIQTSTTNGPSNNSVEEKLKTLQDLNKKNPESYDTEASDLCVVKILGCFKAYHHQGLRSFEG